LETQLQQISLHLEDFSVVNLNSQEDFSELLPNKLVDYLVKQLLLEVFLDKLLPQTMPKQI